MSYSKTTSFIYDALEKKHDMFVSPEFKVFVDGKILDPANFHITDCEVNIPLTIGGTRQTMESGSCSFSLQGMFDLEKHSFSNNLEKTVAVGKQVMIKGGYRNPPVLFKGTIKSVAIKYKQGGASYEVEGLDIVDSLRGGVQLNTFNKENPSKTIKDILSKVISQGHSNTSLGTIDNIDPLVVSLVQEGIDNADFIYMLARRFGKTFAVIHGQMVFTDMLKNEKLLGTLTYGKNLFSFKKQLNTTGLYGSVTVNGVDSDGKAIQGVCKKATVKGTGKTAAQFDTDVSERSYEEEDGIAQTAQALKNYAESIMNENNMNFVSGKASCIGIPELIPGRYIKLDGMSSRSNGTYFITSVTHSFSDGFTTSFEFKGAKSV